jgi:hypothetical protein
MLRRCNVFQNYRRLRWLLPRNFFGTHAQSVGRDREWVSQPQRIIAAAINLGLAHRARCPVGTNRERQPTARNRQLNSVHAGYPSLPGDGANVKVIQIFVIKGSHWLWVAAKTVISREAAMTEIIATTWPTLLADALHRPRNPNARSNTKGQRETGNGQRQTIVDVVWMR